MNKIVQRLKSSRLCFAEHKCTSAQGTSVVGKDFVMQSEGVASSLSLVYCLFSILYFTLHTSDFTLRSPRERSWNPVYLSYIVFFRFLTLHSTLQTSHFLMLHTSFLARTISLRNGDNRISSAHFQSDSRNCGA